MPKMIATAIREAIDSGEKIYICSPHEYYYGQALECDGECFSLLCESTVDGIIESALWVLKISSMTGVRRTRTTWNVDRLNRIETVEPPAKKP
jgi:hypothetical protein